ncbi:hypothetical protein DRP04_05230 [Archaeoglobales archaeon]|nr:MAG: hypothetical protein DRP04_05230 [Archaeoglobales archaeon]
MNPDIATKYFRASSRYANVTRVFDLHEILELLFGMGYEPLGGIPPRVFGYRAGASGQIARKGGVVVDINTDSRIIGVFGLDIAQTMSEFKAIEDGIRKQLMIDLKNYFYEILAEFEVFSGNNPIEAFSNLGDTIEGLEEISCAPDTELSLYGVKLCWKGKIPDSPEWAEVRIEPLSSKADKTYYVSVIYRHVDWSKLSLFAENIIEFVKGLIEYIEGKREGEG